MAEKLTAENINSFIEDSDLPVLVDFYNDGCIPCRRIAPLLSKAETEYSGRIKFAKVNVGANAELIEEHSVEAAPTLIIYKNGKEVNRHRGAADAETLNKFIESVL